MPPPKILFVTGRLAEPALRRMLSELEPKVDFSYSIQVMPITVAALMTPAWIARRLQIPTDVSQIVLPGYCDGDLGPIRAVTSLPLVVGPKDLRRLPEHFGLQRPVEGLGQWDIQIIGEINHAPRMELAEIVRQAKQLQADGATFVDVGCEPNSTWTGVADCVKALVDEGIDCSVDSLNPLEIAPAVKAGAQLVLSVNSSNREAAPDWGCEVVVIPDDIRNIDSLDETLDFLSSRQVPLRIDPILEPIGLGFTESLGRYIAARKKWPEAEMMMGIGNITELTDVDSAGANVLLLAICQELQIRSVLTTQVINWARSSVKECDIARRLVHYAVANQVPPKHLTSALVMLRDPKVVSFGGDQIRELATRIKDNNYRIFAEEEQVHLLGSGQHFASPDPFAAFDQLMASNPTNVDASHAFYLGYEMCKAMLALQLGKQYTQDEALNWGLLTVPETDRHRLKRSRVK